MLLLHQLEFKNSLLIFETTKEPVRSDENPTF
jgi:hypothetical protein